MPTASGHDPVTAHLRPLLARQLGRLRSRYLWFGLAKAVLWIAVLVALFFVLDRWLRLPTAVRLLHTLITVAVGSYAIARFVRYPLSRRFRDRDLALWIEHTYPDLHQRLISAVQLHDADARELRNQSRAMIERLWQETIDRTRELDLRALFDHRALGRVTAGAVLLVAALAIGAVSAPATARTFALRHLGIGVDYPRETTLLVELPPAGPDLQRTDHDGETELVMPAGADLHVSVLAKGVVPKEAFLDLRTLRSDGTTGDRRSVPLTPRPGDRFRHVFRRLSGSFEFHARGGDDEHGDRLVVVRTVRPAQVATLTASITPPAYTGVDHLEQVGGAIEALVGSRVALSVEATAPVRTATMVFLEDGRRLPLAARNVQDDGGAATAFAGEFVLTASDRYQIELVADTGLRNPNPGTYPISVLQDYAPVGRWLLPEDDTFALQPTGLLCLRIDARDDFGLTRVDLSVERDTQQVLQRSLMTPAGDGRTRAGAPVQRLLPTELIEVRELLDDDATGKGLFLQVTLADNRLPEAGRAELPRRIVQIVDPPQLASLIAKAFRRLREEVTQAHDVQRDRRARLADLLARTGDTTPPGEAEFAQVLTGVEVGQGRIQSALQRVHRGLMRSFDLHLWNRLEPSQHAAAVVELYREHSATLTEARALDPEFYRDLIRRRRDSTLGAMETTLDPILAMIDLTDQIANGDAPVVAELLAKAQVARGPSDRGPLLAEVQRRQAHIEGVLQQLLLRLEEWNDYQDLVQEVRALRDRQRDLQSRTEEVRGK
ncbi:MAG TPA: hypothetical protein ENI87_14055 [bacterium]|nr:hypothetical protein [bacterium]